MKKKLSIEQKDLIARIEAFLTANSMSARSFCEDVMGDVAFLHKLRKGRDIRLTTLKKIEDVIG